MYFEHAGKVNTDEAIKLAIKTAKSRDIKTIVVASNSGATAKLLINKGDFNIVCVSHVNGFAKPGENEMSPDARKELRDAGIEVLTTTHLLSGAERGISHKFGGVYPVEIIAHSLRMLGQGIKVCVETTVMALDAGLVPYGTPVISIGGSGTGADTVAIITPSHANSIFETKIHEIICKPALM